MVRKISFVIPCYRSEHTLAAVHEGTDGDDADFAPV